MTLFVTGTQAEFDTWHATALANAGIPAEGKIGVYRGSAATDKQKTTAVAIPIAHPTISDSFAWVTDSYPHPTKSTKTHDEIKTEGFYPVYEGDF